MSRLFILLHLYLFTACQWNDDQIQLEVPSNSSSSFKTAADIPPPAGFKRMQQPESSFGQWLRNLAIRQNNKVYLYNGSLKRNQTAQFAVLDISVGKKDLQQCADAVMRMRAEYLFDQKQYDAIAFRDNNGKSYRWTGNSDRAGFDRYLETVFGWCGSASLEKQLKPVTNAKEIAPGDVLIRGGFPGHAMIVMDVAVNSKHEKVFMLAQSYMPAQDIHIVRNPLDESMGAWYKIDESLDVITPEWDFTLKQLRRW